MNEGDVGEDFYGLQEQGIISGGCCLLCEDRYVGCLCYECNCKKCYWLISAEDWNGEKGRCGLALKRKKEKEEKEDGNKDT